MVAVTELATNAISHTASGQNGTFSVRVRTAPRWGRLEVADEGPREGPPASRNGWGLTIVNGVTDRAAAIIRPDGGRVAWCEVTWPA
jgi:two-component sensor histidine kinase